MPRRPNAGAFMRWVLAQRTEGSLRHVQRLHGSLRPADRRCVPGSRRITRVIRGLCGALPLAVLVSSISAAQPAATQLPRVAMELFPASARDAVAQAYRDAEARPTDAQAAGTLARVLQAWEQWNAAHEAYLRAQALAPRAFEWHYLDAVVLQRLARHKEAAERLRMAVTLSDYAPARVKLAESLFEAGAPGESRNVYEALAREPASEPMGQFGIGRVAASEGRHDEALEHLRRAVALFPQWGAAHYALALSYRALGRRDEARQELELQAKYGPQWPALDESASA